MIAIRFLDTGGGIDASILPTIFDPFTSKKDEGGMGVGLNVAQKIIHNHQGTISASNQENGALFELFLPCDGSICH
ncbi:MAG: ATP-binding protein [Sulfurimonadaceae bacterium]|jgi:signal transduction histidine kinase|nr:ATP-binding protein [Sulfurimonadaceae bacterium]